jgi:hypothetical protein
MLGKCQGTLCHMKKTIDNVEKTLRNTEKENIKK